MAYEIELLINGKPAKFIRNEEANLRDIMNATKVQRQQLLMYQNPEGPTNEDVDLNEENLARFAVEFWHKQFTTDDIIWGSTIETVNTITAAVLDALGVVPAEDGDDDDSKKSPSTTSKRSRTNSKTSTKTNSSKVTSLTR
ncbi:MAG: hypothetical protein LKF36_05490 [Lactobacillus sp.]|jgi:hypothetical protein|nr:hypothetical protein [Lactobacillus sp.]